METNYCREILKQELSDRKRKNSMYSLRAFARDLGIGSTSLSDALANKRKISKRNIQKIANKLALTPAQVDLIINETKENYVKNGEEVERLQVEEDTFRLISDWYYLAILNLSKISDNQSDHKWVANRLGISELEAENAISRLLRIGLLKISDNKLIRTSLPISTTRNIPSSAIQKHHKNNLELAEKSLEQDNVHVREFSSVTMAINLEKLPEAKEILMKAKRKVSKLLESGDPKEVYVLSFQVFPLTRSFELDTNFDQVKKFPE